MSAGHGLLARLVSGRGDGLAVRGPPTVHEHGNTGREQGGDGDQGDLPAGHAADDYGVDPSRLRWRRVPVPAGRTGRERLGERGGRDGAEPQQGTGQPGQRNCETADVADGVHDDLPSVRAVVGHLTVGRLAARPLSDVLPMPAPALPGVM